MVSLTDRTDMTLDVYRGRKTTIQQQQQSFVFELSGSGVVGGGEGLWGRENQIDISSNNDET